MQHFGRAFLIEDDRKFIFQRHIAHIRPLSNVNPTFLVHVLNSPAGFQQAKKAARGVAQPTVTLGELKRIRIPLCPTAEQQEIVSQVQNAFEAVDLIYRWIDDMISNLDRLDQAILAKAFHGELAPQDPNDEPASVLLARIRVQRAQQAEATKGKRRMAKAQGGNKMGKKSSSLVAQRRPLAEVLIDKGQAMASAQLLAEAGYDDATIEEFYLALREEIAQGRIREDRPSENDVMLEVVRP